MLELGKRSAKIAIDTETTGLNTFIGARPYIVSWCWFDHQETRGHVRWEVDPFTRRVSPNPEDLATLRKMLLNTSILKVFHNAKFDLRMLESVGLEVQGRIEDTAIMLRCYHNDLPTYGLKPVCKKVLKIDDDDLVSLKKACMRARARGKKLGWMLADDLEPDYWMVEDRTLVARYAVMDAFRTKRLHAWLEEQFIDDNQRAVYEKELRLMPVTYDMETRGVSLDPAKVEVERNYHIEAAKKSYDRFLEIGGVKEINLKSPDQLAALFYDKLKIECKTFTEKGKRAVNVDSLVGIKHPIVDALTDYKASTHALANFFDIYKRESEKTVDGKWILHPDFQQMGAITGRFSCRRPNLQNVANALTTRSMKPIQARRPFRPEPGFTWFCFDYSQIEVWVFAILSQEKLMLDALLSGRDLHNETANHVWGRGQDIVAIEKAANGKSNTRARAKMMLFGKIYGMGIAAAVDLIRCTPKEAQQYLEDFDRAFPGIVKFMKDYSRRAESQGHITNAYGRRYFIDPNFSYRAVNYLIQGSCADLLKEKMIETAALLKRRGVEGGLIMTIHDELVFEIRNKYVTRNLLLEIKDTMEDHHGLFKTVKKFKVEASKVTSAGSWDKKVKLKL